MQSHLVQVSQRLTLHALSTPPLAQSTVPSRAVTVFLLLVSVLSLSATVLHVLAATHKPVLKSKSLPRTL